MTTIETHSATLTFDGSVVRKRKKPVDLGFLDFRSLEARRTALDRELVLNRRFAPDVYLRTEAVVADGVVVDHELVMRRMPADRRLSMLVAAHEDVDGALLGVARRLAVVHEAAQRPPAWLDPNAELHRNWEDNLAALAASDELDAASIDEMGQLARRYLAGRGELLAARERDGHLRDGHGDLLADDIFCLPDGPRILDCLDFDERYRYGDVLLDAAFLAMDLERLGREDLGRTFLAGYAELSRFGHHPASLADHYVAYRAGVRAKVALVRAAQSGRPLGSDARWLVGIAMRHLRRARVRLVLVGGLPGVGKSTLATALSDRLGWVLLRSDEVRKDLHGWPHDRRLPDAAYGAEATRATYAELLDRARTALALGCSVVLDATWADATRRAEARAVAAATASDVHELRCTAPSGLVLRRLAGRAAHGARARAGSDADGDVHAAMAQHFAPWPQAHDIDMSRELSHATVLAAALTRRSQAPALSPVP